MKKKIIPVVLAIVLIIIIGCVSFGGAIIDKYSYSKERADMDAYYEISSDSDVAVLQTEMSEERAKLIDGVYYFDIDTVHKYLNDRFYVDKNENLLLYSLPDDTVRTSIGSSVRENSLTNEDMGYVLSRFEGDMLYIPGGMPHAIGGGCLIYEVQQSSDTTYRFYDWDRKGPDGKGRALHIEECFKSIDFDIPPSRLCRDDLQSPFFHIRTHNLDDAVEFTPDGSSFIAGFVLSGATDVAGHGESFLIPASSTAVKVTPTVPGTKLIITEL